MSKNSGPNNKRLDNQLITKPFFYKHIGLFKN